MAIDTTNNDADTALADAVLAATDEASIPADVPVEVPAFTERKPEPWSGEAAPAPKAEAPKSEPAPTAPAPQVPSLSMDEFLRAREEAQALKTRLAEFEKANAKPVEMPDPFLDPSGFARATQAQYIEQNVAPVIRQLQIQAANNNLSVARSIHGQELADKAYAEFDKALPGMHPADKERVMSAANPFIAAVDWMKQRDLMAEVGNDAGAYREKLISQLLTDPEFLGRASEAARSFAAGNVQSQQPRTASGQFASSNKPAPIPSVNRAGSASESATYKGHTPTDDELVEEALSGRR